MIFLYILTIILVFVVLLKSLSKKYYLWALCPKVRTVNGEKLEDCIKIVPGKTIFGNIFDHLSADKDEVFQAFRDYKKVAKNGLYLQQMLITPIYNITTAEAAEPVLKSSNLITKTVTYEMLHQWLGLGLLTSTNDEWAFKRKLLTNSFHFSILRQALETFKNESQKFIEDLNCTNEGAETVISLTKLIPKFTLSAVCNAAFGVNISNFKEKESYIKNTGKYEALVTKYQYNVFAHIVNIIFGTLLETWKLSKSLKKFSEKIIRTRKDELSRMESQIFTGDNKQRYAMLDALLIAESSGLIKYKQVCNEVDTFMFEGFDTTSSGITACLIMLSLHQNVQKRCFEEILTLNDDLTTFTIKNCQDLKYLECVIKESLRLYPPVPVMGRMCHEETEIGNFILPKRSSVVLHVFDIHRDPKHFPNPLKFDPDRFLPENVENRHPFAFIAFSAGSRNCIGQKFVMLEIKTFLANLIKTYQILPVNILSADDIQLKSGVILKIKNNIDIKLMKR